MNLVKVEDNASLVRDSETTAVLSIDNAGLIAYKKRKRDSRKVEDLEEKVEAMADQLTNIEKFLERLVNGSDR